MNQPAEPMTTFTLDEWRAYKRAVRRLKYVQRRRQGKEADPAAWLAACARDSLTDPYEQEDYRYEQA
jgi:hypothetical protein